MPGRADKGIIVDCPFIVRPPVIPSDKKTATPIELATPGFVVEREQECSNTSLDMVLEIIV